MERRFNRIQINLLDRKMPFDNVCHFRNVRNNILITVKINILITQQLPIHPAELRLFHTIFERSEKILTLALQCKSMEISVLWSCSLYSCTYPINLGKNNLYISDMIQVTWPYLKFLLRYGSCRRRRRYCRYVNRL